MRKYLFLLSILVPALCFAGSLQQHQMQILFMWGVAGGGASPDFTEDFNTSDTGDVASNTNFGFESDANSELDIYSNELRYYASTSGRSGYVMDTATYDNAAEVTATFEVQFEDISAIDDGSSSTIYHRFRNNDGSAIVAQVRFVASGGDLAVYRVCRGDGTECDDVTWTGVAADTKYYCYFYAKVNASTGGAALRCDTDSDISDSSWAEATTGFNDDNSADLGIGRLDAGCSYNGWGDGSTDTYIYGDNYQAYAGDQR